MAPPSLVWRRLEVSTAANRLLAATCCRRRRHRPAGSLELTGHELAGSSQAFLWLAHLLAGLRSVSARSGRAKSRKLAGRRPRYKYGWPVDR